MRCVCVQLRACFKDWHGNVARAEELLNSVDLTGIDIILFPEMCFTGYCFEDKADIEAFVEDRSTGRTAEWAKQLALRTRAYVQVGFPRCENAAERSQFYNSISLFSPTGLLVTTYDKHFLFETDERWALEGSSFCSIETPALGTIGFGICMDINPYKFQTPFEAFEFANYHVKAESDIILCSMAWILPLGSPAPKFAMEKHDIMMNTISYWIARMQPLIDASKTSDRNIKVVISNRIGSEKDAYFVGCSCGFVIEGGKVIVNQFIGPEIEKVMILDL